MVANFYIAAALSIKLANSSFCFVPIISYGSLVLTFNPIELLNITIIL